MPTLLRLDTSARTTGSHSRALGDTAETRWRAAHPSGTVTRRDLGTNPVPILTETAVAGFFVDTPTPAQQKATAPSDALIAELKAADTLLITAPIYNFGVPATLKAWIDQITRIGHTFAYEDGAFRGLVPTRSAIIAAAYGAPGYRDTMKEADFLVPYLTFLLQFLGIETVSILAVEGTSTDLDLTPQLAQADADLARLLAA
ncbi:MAG: NAD(P)H-dependent oxidoreductase [Pseudomonadota bacterium]